MSIMLRNMTSVYLRREGRILLLHRVGSKVVSTSWTGAAGGHFEPEELNNPRACILRELQEETGLTENDVENLALRYITMRRVGDEIRVNHYYFADLKKCADPLQSNEGTLAWFAPEQIPGLEMPYSAKHMMQHYLSVGHATDDLYCGICSENGIIFQTMQPF